MKKIFVFIALFILVLAGGFCVEFPSGIFRSDEQPWRLLEQAKIAFAQKDFGTALRLANEARANKAREYGRYLSTLTAELRPQQVQRAGDRIDGVLSVLRDRDSTAAVEIITGFLDRYGEEYFRGRITELTTHIKKNAALPEADYLVGDIYLIEGELDLAKSYYLQAWENAFALDIPESKYNILYQLARIGELQNDDELFEQSLLLILADDPYAGGFQHKDGRFIRGVIQNIERGYSADKLFFMYRTDTFRALNAYLSLASFYRRAQNNGDYLATATLAMLTVCTRMYNALVERDRAYTFTTLSDFFSHVLYSQEIAGWADSHKGWEALLLFADAVKKNGQHRLSREILDLLWVYAPEHIREEAYLLRESTTPPQAVGYVVSPEEADFGFNTPITPQGAGY
ncbi:MAG: hypothetical protein LBS64_01825 [Spirochaetaceae bacterium]|jgi:hypothetical protein|nr:hypothetical protein [Spirochaetaceae bacterium]